MINVQSHETYGVSAPDYLARAEIRIAAGCREDLFYAALELRTGVEVRLKEYLEEQHHISKKKRQGWQIAKLNKSVEQAFRLGDRVVEMNVFESKSRDLIARLYYTPVKAGLRKNAERLGDYLHAVGPKKVARQEWWWGFRGLVHHTAEELKEATSGTLLGPPMLNPATKEVYTKITGFTSDKMRQLLNRLEGQDTLVRVRHFDHVPHGSRSEIF